MPTYYSDTGTTAVLSDYAYVTANTAEIRVNTNEGEWEVQCNDAAPQDFAYFMDEYGNIQAFESEPTLAELKEDADWSL